MAAARDPRHPPQSAQSSPPPSSRRVPGSLDGATDAELMKGASEGDLGAIGELYDRHARHVWRVARRSLDDMTAEDVVHQLFLKLPELARSYDGRPRCRGWLCGIAIRLAIRQRRGAGRFGRILAAFSHTLSGRSTRTPEGEAMTRQGLSQLEVALGKLSEKNRVVFVLVELEDLSSEEVAGLLQIPAGTVRRRLFQARRELQAAMKEGESDGT